MQPGKRDRLITFQRNGGTTDAFGGQSEAWAALTVGTWAGSEWAEKIDVSDGERWKAGEVAAQVTTRFRTLSHAGTRAVLASDRITFDGVNYDISGIKEIGREQGIEFTCAARIDLA